MSEWDQLLNESPWLFVINEQSFVDISNVCDQIISAFGEARLDRLIRRARWERFCRLQKHDALLKAFDVLKASPDERGIDLDEEIGGLDVAIPDDVELGGRRLNEEEREILADVLMKSVLADIHHRQFHEGIIALGRCFPEREWR
jgi:hypothetical protein